MYDNKLKEEEIEFIMKESELNNYKIDEIKDDENSNLILLGLIDESHYIPVKKIKNTEDKIVRVRSGYNNDLKNFNKMIENLKRIENERILKENDNGIY